MKDVVVVVVVVMMVVAAAAAKLIYIEDWDAVKNELNFSSSQATDHERE